MYFSGRLYEGVEVIVRAVDSGSSGQQQTILRVPEDPALDRKLKIAIGVLRQAGRDLVSDEAHARRYAADFYQSDGSDAEDCAGSTSPQQQQQPESGPEQQQHQRANSVPLDEPTSSVAAVVIPQRDDPDIEALFAVEPVVEPAVEPAVESAIESSEEPAVESSEEPTVESAVEPVPVPNPRRRPRCDSDSDRAALEGPLTGRARIEVAAPVDDRLAEFLDTQFRSDIPSLEAILVRNSVISLMACHGKIDRMVRLVDSASGEYNLTTNVVSFCFYGVLVKHYNQYRMGKSWLPEPCNLGSRPFRTDAPLFLGQRDIANVMLMIQRTVPGSPEHKKHLEFMLRNRKRVMIFRIVRPSSTQGILMQLSKNALGKVTLPCLYEPPSDAALAEIGRIRDLLSQYNSRESFRNLVQWIGERNGDPGFVESFDPDEMELAVGAFDVIFNSMTN